MKQNNLLSAHPEILSDAALEEWFQKKEWLCGLNLTPDPGINVRAFALHYYAFPQRWQKTFEFLGRTDLSSLPLGRIDLEENCFALISEYTSKNPEDARFEAHKSYIDLQYVIEGEELMGCVPLETTTPLIPFNPEKDILFVTSTSEKLSTANPGNFFIFFPSDAHRPGVKSSQNSKIRKLVVKIGMH